MTSLYINVIFVVHLKGGNEIAKPDGGPAAQSHGTMLVEKKALFYYSLGVISENVSRVTEGRYFGNPVFFRRLIMTLANVFSGRKAQSAIEYTILFAIIAMLTLIGFSQVFPKIQAAGGTLFNKAVKAMK